MERAFATLELRATNDELREFEGIASTGDLDTHGTIFEPSGAQISLPIPLLWFHDQTTPVGEVTHAELRAGRWHVKGVIRLVTEDGLVKNLTDRAWHSVKYKLVRGLSIGALPLKREGNRFLQWALRELSLVTVPSNQAATILTVRSAYNAASGGTSNHPGVTGSLTPRHGKMTIAEQITQYENTRAAKVAARDALIEKSGAEGVTLASDEQETFDNLDGEIRSIDEHLVRLARVKETAKPATPVAGHSLAAASQSRSGEVVNRQGIPVVTVRPNTSPGISMARHAMVLCQAKGNTFEAARIATRNWGDSAAEIVANLEGRAAVAPGTTVETNWALPLVHTNYINEFLELLRPLTLIGRIPGLRHVPFNVSMPAQTAGGTYAWVGEGKPKPVTKPQYASVTLGKAKAAGIIVLTKELVKLSTPSAQEAVRDEMLKGIQQFLDTQFIDSTVAAVSNVNPASITNGVTGTAASGTDVADARSDFAARIAAFASSNYGLNGLVILMNESMAFTLGLMTNAQGNPAFPGLGINGGTILGIPVVTSETVGAQIIFAHAPSIFIADEGGIEIDASEEASVQMDSAPTDPPVDATVLTSFWQMNLVGLRVERHITWGKARSTAVDRITSAAYAA